MNDIERAELLHKQLCGESASTGDRATRDKMHTHLLLLLKHLQSMSSRDAFFPRDVAQRLDQLLRDAQSRAHSTHSTRVRNPAELCEHYALLKKHFASATSPGL